MMENPVLQVKCEDGIDNQLDEVSKSQQEMASSEVKVKCEPIDFDFGNDHKNDFMQSAICDNIKDEAVECFSFKSGFDTVYNLTNEAVGSDKSEQNADKELPSNTDFKMEYDSNIDSSDPSEITIKQEGDDDFNDESISNHQDDVKEDDKDTNIRKNKRRTSNKTISSDQKCLKKCHFCELYFASVSSRNRHILDIHEQIQHNCQFCKKGYSRAYDLKQHIIVKHEGKRYTCKLCENTFSYPTGLRQHMNAIHEGKRSTCEICHSTFSQAGYLKIHMESVHNSIRYECEQCKSSFSNSYNLTQHIRSKHEGKRSGKRYACDQCESSFSRSGYLKYHMRSKHEEKRF